MYLITCLEESATTLPKKPLGRKKKNQTQNSYTTDSLEKQTNACKTFKFKTGRQAPFPI